MLVLKQHSSVVGDNTVYVSKVGLRIDMPNTSTTILCTPPEWKMFVFNASSKLCYETTVDKFEGQFIRAIGLILGPVRNSKFWKKQPDWTNNGVPAVHFTRQLTEDEQKEIKLKSGKRTVKADFWGLKSSDAPKAACDLACKVDNVPSLSALPLEVNYTQDDGSTATTLKTVSASKLPLSAKLFVRPGGLKLAKSDTEVFLDKSAMDMLDGLKDQPLYR